MTARYQPGYPSARPDPTADPPTQPLPRLRHPGTRPSRWTSSRRWRATLGALLALTPVVVLALIWSMATRNDPDNAAPRTAEQRTAAGERALTAAGFSCQDTLADPAVRRCLRAEGPVMAALGWQSGPAGQIQRVHIDVYGDEMAYLADGGDYDNASRQSHADRVGLARSAYRAMVPALYGRGPAEWIDKIGEPKAAANGHGVAAAFADNGHTTQVVLLPRSAPDPAPPTERPLILRPAQFTKTLEEAGFNCDNPYRECRMPKANTRPGEIAVAAGLTPETLFTARLRFSITEPTPRDDTNPDTVARAFVRILKLAGYDDATVAEKVTAAVTTGGGAAIDTEHATVFVNATITRGKASYAALRVQGVRL
jgi:hypothetical protein